MHRATNEETEIKEIPWQEFDNSTPEKRMVRNRTTLQNLMAMKWESDTQVYSQTRALQFYF